MYFFFFFQAEDGIRDADVTGVQTCALPIMLRDQTQANNAEVQAKRYEDLLKRGLIAQEQYDGLKTTADSLAATIRADEADIKSAEETVRADEAAVKSAEETVRADEATVENAKLQLSYANIRAPIDGRTGSLVLHEGNI